MHAATTGSFRPAAVAGMFYPAAAAALAHEIDGHLRAAGPVPTRAPKMVIAPHAGTVYSGPVAGPAYAQFAAARTRVRRVVLLGPAHRVALRGLAVPTVDAFATPLGRVPLDHDALAALGDLPQVVASDAAHADEHSLEVQLPFLQRSLGAFALVPLVVGRATAGEVAQVLERLWGGDETVIVISSDLSHYLPYEQARRVDRDTVERICRLDGALDHGQACGATPIAGALVAARRSGLQARLLDLRNSGDTAGDRARVVGYASIAFETPASPAADPEDDDVEADPALGDALLARARNAIAGAFARALHDEPPHPRLAQPGATFVTLQLGGALRGCVGTLEPRRPLGEDVRVQARAAAFGDPRFAPLAAHEFDAVDFEVSLLGPPAALAARDEADAQQRLRPGVDGVVLEWRGHRATFLPQVWQQLPAAPAFLAALKRKAGLPADFWHAELRLARYRVAKFAARREAA